MSVEDLIRLGVLVVTKLAIHVWAFQVIRRGGGRGQKSLVLPYKVIVLSGLLILVRLVQIWQVK